MLTVSLCGEETLSATGKSKNAAIWISDADSDTEDEDDDESQDSDDSQSCATPPSTSLADHLGKYLTLFHFCDRS